MRFSILTTVYNRANTLAEAYLSLCVQTFQDFEWVVIDDGSTEPIGELVASWKPFFPIRYTRKSNGGKHTAVNVGLTQVIGDFTLILDSDDSLLPNALERFDFWTRRPPMPSALRRSLRSITSATARPFWASPFPRTTWMSASLDISSSPWPSGAG